MPADADAWDVIASTWARLWGSFTAPAHDALVTAAAIGPGTRVLDMGCGSGEFLAYLTGRGAMVTGVDPSVGMVAAARRSAPGAVVSLGSWEAAGVDSSSVDVLTAVNSLQLADDLRAALREVARLLRRGGVLAVAEWAEPQRNDLDVIHRALADVDGDDAEEPALDAAREPDALEDELRGERFTIRDSGLVSAIWRASDGADLVAGLLLGEDSAVVAELRDVILEAAAPFRTPDGGYAFENALRWVVAVAP